VAAPAVKRTRRPKQPGLFDGLPDSGGLPVPVASERELLALAVELGARGITGWSDAESALTDRLPSVPRRLITDVRDLIREGRDPLGEILCSLRSPLERRAVGATYTPPGIVQWMIGRAASAGDPDRIVDPGAGSGRFLMEASWRFPRAPLEAVEIDPAAAILARANLAVLGLASRARVTVGDYRSIPLDPPHGSTLFIGNPPYVRHHLIEPQWKQWLTREAARRGLNASQLAGLHVYFFLATLLKARPGDRGAFITAAEWLDVNYGSLVRELLVGDLGGSGLVVIEPTAMPFADAATTAVITSFEVGSRPPTVSLRRVATLEELQHPGDGHFVRRERLEAEKRWSHLTRSGHKGPAGYVELGELCRVHRGQVTGLNKVWIAGPHASGLPQSVLYPTVTRARELFQAGSALEDPSLLRRVIDLPADLDEFDADDRRTIERFLAVARSMGADRGYVARNRRAWWSVGLREAAPILTTYMARRPPAFVRNLADARHINIAHGLYPREPMSERALQRLAEYLSRTTAVADGRTYAGGLTKFEPREVERLLVPDLALLERGLP
jgi:adenine-specific DNA-methyltransferase